MSNNRSVGRSQYNGGQNGYNTGSGRRRNAGYSGNYHSSSQNHHPRRKNRDMSAFVVMTMGILAAVAIITALAVTFVHSGSKKNNSGFADTSSQLPVSKSDDIIIGFDEDEEEEVSSEVSSEDVTHADFSGSWKKTDVYESQKATLSITNQDAIGFDFTLTIWNDGKTGSLSGNAAFTGESTAVCSQGSAAITFERGSKYLSVYHTGKNSALGLSDSFTIDGKFTTGSPNYYQKEETNHYDYNVYKSSAVVSALKSTLSADDYNLYQEMMQTGLMSPIAYERTVDKNGKNVNVDTELKCVKYYAVMSSIGMNMVMMCSDSGKIYVLFYDVEEMRYYTNDNSYSSKMPDSFQTIANSKGMKPIFK